VTRFSQAHISDLRSRSRGRDAAADYGKCGQRCYGGGENGQYRRLKEALTQANRKFSKPR
jgi:hypothetical protein